MSEKFPGHGIVRTNRRARIGGSIQLFGEKIRPEKIRPENVPPKILTLLDAFDEILTLLGPFMPTKSGFLAKSLPYSTIFQNSCTRSSGTDAIFSTQRCPRGRDPEFIYTKNWRGRDPDFIYTNFIYQKNFPAARA